MRTQLIVDFSDRAFCALLVTPEGQLLHCSHEIRRVTNRYFSSEVLFDPCPSESPDFAWDEAMEVLAKADARSFFQRARHLGLRRPWDLQAPTDALRLPSPLAVLSSPVAQADPSVAPVLPGVAVLLLDALLDPVFSFLGSCGLAAGGIDAVVVVPARTGRQAQLALHKVFRHRGFRRLTLLPREIAAAMALLEEPPSEYLVWDVTGDDLQLHRVAVEAGEGGRRLRTVEGRTVRGLGWLYWVRQVAAALAAQGRIPDPPGALLSALDRTLMGLLGGSHDPTELPTRPPLRLTHGLLHEVLDGEWRARLVAELGDRIRPRLEELGAPATPVILLGAACSLEPIERLFLSLAGGAQPLVVEPLPALERAARGVAAAHLWLRGGPGRRVELPPSGGLRLDTLHGEACELLPAEQLPRPGEQCHLRQSFRLAGDRGAADSFLVHLLWGSDVSPEGNASLCVLPLEIGPGEEERDLWLALHLRRSADGRRLSGTVEAGFDSGAASPARAFFAKDLATLPSPMEG